MRSSSALKLHSKLKFSAQELMPLQTTSKQWTIYELTPRNFFCSEFAHTDQWPPVRWQASAIVQIPVVYAPSLPSCQLTRLKYHLNFSPFETQ
jgi:hypothetical protein